MRTGRLIPPRVYHLKQESRLPGYEQLYNDSMRRRLKLEALAQLPPEEATFRPRVRLGQRQGGRKYCGPWLRCVWACPGARKEPVLCRPWARKERS